MLYFFLKSNITTSLTEKSVKSDFLDTGNRFQEILAHFDALPLIPWHAIVFSSFLNFENKNFLYRTAPRLFTPQFFNRCKHLWWGSQQQQQATLRVCVRVQRAAEPTASGTLAIQKALHRHQGRVPQVVNAHLSICVTYGSEDLCTVPRCHEDQG